MLLYDTIRSSGLNWETAEAVISNWSVREIGGFIEKCDEALGEGCGAVLSPEVETSAKSVFDFGVSSEFSGLPFPCATLECRLKKADQFARFASQVAKFSFAATIPAASGAP